MKKLDRTTRASDKATTQHSALCFRRKPDGSIDILLVTSRDSGRWVIPKGWPMKGMTGAESAEQEAYEEAGAEGRLFSDCVGLYSYDKGMDDGTLQPCVVSVFPLEVTKLRRKYPERDQRTRRWFSPKKAARKVDEPELRTILMEFDPGSLAAPKSGKA